MTSPTNRDARERLAAAIERTLFPIIYPETARLFSYDDDLPHDQGLLPKCAAAILALLSPDEVEGMGSDRNGLASDLRSLKAQFERIASKEPDEQPHYKNGVRPFGTGDLRHAIETLGRAALLADQPLPSVATGHPEQGALLSGWQDIGTARKKHGEIVLLFDGNRVFPGYWGASTYDRSIKKYRVGWVTGPSSPEYQPTHWMPLPAPPPLPADGSGHCTESTTDASRAPGTNNNPPRKGGE